jgi:hypothetical protein
VLLEVLARKVPQEQQVFLALLDHPAILELLVQQELLDFLVSICKTSDNVCFTNSHV